MIFRFVDLRCFSFFFFNLLPSSDVTTIVVDRGPPDFPESVRILSEIKRELLEKLSRAHLINPLAQIANALAQRIASNYTRKHNWIICPFFTFHSLRYMTVRSAELYWWKSYSSSVDEIEPRCQFLPAFYNQLLRQFLVSMNYKAKL